MALISRARGARAGEQDGGLAVIAVIQPTDRSKWPAAGLSPPSDRHAAGRYTNTARGPQWSTGQAAEDVAGFSTGCQVVRCLNSVPSSGPSGQVVRSQ